ncbi:ATP-binding protein [Lacibacterium aquatile]|uniref:histidine kinase n=1 Tax=Lacibacterium aquatile TaxID=1168082 RepID=A0ABW5DKA6_9PROT
MDVAETLWQEFANETEEHIELLEPLLAGAGSGLSSEDIAQLFRSFHSVKGVARAMDVGGMEQISHGAENILGLVREGHAQLEEAVVDILLQAVDALKRLRADVVVSRQNVEAPAEIVAMLDRVYGLLKSAVPEASSGGGGGGSELAPSVASTGISASELHEDVELLSVFADVMGQRLPDVALAVSPQVDEPAVREQILDAVQSLAHGADVMEFEALAETFKGIETLLPADRSVTDEVRRELLPLLGQLRTQAELLGEAVGADVGVAAFASALTVALGPSVATLIQDLSNAVSHVELTLIEEGGIPSEADAAEIVSLSKIAGIALGCLGHQLAADLLALVEDLFARAAQGAVTPTTETLAATRAILEAVDPRLPFQPGLYRDSDISESESEELAATFRGALAAGAARGPAEGRLVGSAYIRGQLFEALTGDQVPQVEEMLEAGFTAYTMLLHLEADTDIAGTIVGWLTGEAKAITNRTVLRGHESWFEFLVLSFHAPEQVTEMLAQIDPRQRCLRLLRQLTEEPAGIVLLGTEEEDEEIVTAAAPVVEEQAVERAGPAQQRGQGGMVLRVRSDSIDRFMVQIGELRVIATGLTLLADDGEVASAITRIRQTLGELPAHVASELSTALATIDSHQRKVRDLDQRLDGALVQLHSVALDLRVVPLDTVFNRFPRVVRDLAQSQDKDVALNLEGREVRIDKSMVDLLIDPLMHMVRNAIDHGIETPADRKRAGKPPRASLTLRAVQRSSEAVIEIIDDGRGIDIEVVRQKAVSRGLISEAESRRLTEEEIIRYIFRAGFSTAEVVTDLSGRGVGMDVVLTSVTRMGGSIDVRSTLGKGTTFILQLPLTASLQNTLLVEAAGQTLGIPERNVSAVEDVTSDMIQLVGGQRAILHRGIFLPVYQLGSLLGLESDPTPRARFPLAVVSSGHTAIGIEVDRLLRRQEVFLKDLHPEIAKFPAIGGASILGDGRVVLILDADGLIQTAKRSGRPASALAIVGEEETV